MSVGDMRIYTFMILKLKKETQFKRQFIVQKNLRNMVISKYNRFLTDTCF